MYVITGATGNTGKPITLALLAAGKKVRILSRSAEKAKELTGRGAELFLGGPEDRSVLQRAVAGATAVYAMIPPDWSQPDFTAYQRRVADAIAGALSGSSVKYVVSLSSVGAHLEHNAGVVAGLHYLERKLDGLPGLNVLHLRPTYFMENTLGQIGLVKAMGVMGSPMHADRPMSMIATRDVADYAAGRLLKLDFAGRSVQYLLGRREITYSEVASVFGKAIGKPDLKYVEVPYEQLASAIMGMGATASVADNLNEFIRSFNEGKILEDAKRTQEATTPTTIEDFAKVFADVYSMQA
jgi:uncharacterized protein YbjT (DUF2867 family)